jgi:hypothetical protein
MKELAWEEAPINYNGVHAGMMYRQTNRIRADIWAFEQRMRIRLELLGFVEDDAEPNTYWLQLKEPTND